MKYLLIALFTLFFISCSQEDTNQTPASSTYYLSYNSDSTEVSGTVTFDLGNIPSNHVITLNNFRASLGECSVDLSQGSLQPDSLIFSGSNTKKTAKVSIKLLSSCTNQNLVLTADYQDASILDKTIIHNSKEMTYNFTIDKVSTVSSYTPVLKKSTLDITKNSQNESVTVSVFDNLNRPAAEGSVNVIYPKISTEGVNVGTFSKTTVDIASGEAIFSYTAPSDLQALRAKNITSTSFKFYYNSDVSNYVELHVNFSPEANQTITKEYSISFVPQDETYKMSLEQVKSFSISVIDNENNPVGDSEIIDLNVSVENNNIAELINSNGDTNTSFHFTNKNNVTLTLRSHTTSGLLPINIVSSFIDINGEKQTIYATYNIIVKSGPPTAISISYAGTDQDKVHAKFIEHFVVSVTDKYFNPVNTNPQVSVGSIVGYAKFENDGSSANSDKRIYVDSGTLATLKKDTLTLNSNSLKSTTTIDLNNDTLVTFGNRYTYPASGAWSIKNYDAIAGKINLFSGQYDGNETKNLGFSIGHNYRQDACYFGDEWIGQTKLQNDASTIDNSGNAIIDLSYDYYLVGKDILVYVNIIGKDNTLGKEIKLGEVKKHTLRGHGLEIIGNSTATVLDGAPSRTQKFFVGIKDTVETYRNANFSFEKIEYSDGCKKHPPLPYDIAACKYPDGTVSYGRSYVELQIDAAYGDCSVGVSEPRINKEF